MPRESYPAVRTLSRVYRGLAYIVLCVGLLLVVLAIAQTNNFLVVVAVGLYTGFVFLVLLATGEFLAILPDIADRTQETNSLLQEIRELLSKRT